MNLRLVGSELGQDAAETQGVLAERRAKPIVAGGGGVALVEDQIDDFEDRREASSAVGAARDLERDVGVGECALGPHDALGDGRLRNEEGARDLLGGQTSQQTERESDAALGREHGMTGREHQAQEIVSDIIVDCGFEIRHGHLLPSLEFAAKLSVLTLEQLAAAKPVDGTMLRGGHEPGAWVIGDA